MTGIRLHQIKGDYMAPTLRGGRDLLLVVPADRYDYEGIYLLDLGDGVAVYRADSRPGRHIELYGDNPHYVRQLVSRNWFEAHVVAKAIGTVKMEILPDELASRLGSSWADASARPALA